MVTTVIRTIMEYLNWITQIKIDQLVQNKNKMQNTYLTQFNIPSIRYSKKGLDYYHQKVKIRVASQVSERLKT